MDSILYVLREGWPYLARYRSRLLLGIAFGLFYGVPNAILPLATKALVLRISPPGTSSALSFDAGFLDRALASTLRFLDAWLPLAGRPLDTPQILGGLLFLPLLMAARGAIGYTGSYYMKWISEAVINDLRYDILAQLNRLSLEFFHRHRTGDLISRLNSDTKNFYFALNFGVGDLLKEPAAILGIAAVLFSMDWQLSLFLTLLLPATLVPISILSRKTRQAGQGAIQAEVRQANTLIETIANVLTVKSYGLESLQEQRFRKFARHRFSHNMRANRAQELVNPIIETLSGILLSVLLLFILLTGRQLEDLAAFAVAVGLLYSPIKKLAAIGLRFQRAQFSLERLRDTRTAQPSVPEPAQPLPVPAHPRSLRFDNVHFAYDPERPVLCGFSLDIPAGQTLGIAGESGAGKSSLLALAARFYDPVSGAVLLDGSDIRGFRSSDLRRHIALVTQHIELFDGTIAENIALGRPGASPAGIEDAARAADAHTFISTLPEGYDTPVGERGVRLSGGQRQRLAIARAFVRDAPLLLLDEATAALDARAEAEIQSALRRLMQGRTVLVVAHRLATLRGCHRIIFLREGTLAEEGSFDQLLAANGFFAAMAKIQGLC
jgi:ATP-binding cassette, subfamily B, bacterial MsbA